MNEKKPAGYWTYERCLAEARKYKFKMDFRNGSAGAYDAAKDNGWLSEYVWLESRSLAGSRGRHLGIPKHLSP